MSSTSTNMGLVLWDNVGDYFNFSELVANWNALDDHDHTSGNGVKIPAGGLDVNAVGTTNIANLAVTNAKIADGTITEAKLATSAFGEASWHAIGAGGEPAFTNSWTNVGGSQVVARFKKIAGLVVVQGHVTAGVVPGGPTSGLSPVFTLPTTYRPISNLMFPGLSDTNRIEISAVGVVSINLASEPATANAINAIFPAEQ